ncbi:MAG: NADH-quinone oxidoreductase subunit N [Candidatus Omnitrophica bacterium]|nr:NADH-quinone oxidoreductase subunit N [Candidatus Omnitrophota bacterium]
MSTLQSLAHFKTEIILLIGAFITLFSDSPKGSRFLAGTAALLTLTLAGVAAFTEASQQSLQLFGGFFTLDGATRFFRFGMILAAAASVLLGMTRGAIALSFFAESTALMLFLTFGLIVLCASGHFLTLLLAVEMVSLLSYLMTGFSPQNTRAREAALKYLLLGSFCSAFMLYGISLLFGLTGSLDFDSVRAAVQDGGQRTAAAASLLFILTGAGFKLSLFPFHFWAPDVYEAAPSPVAAYLTVAPKAAACAILIRLFSEVFPSMQTFGAEVLQTLCILTLLAASLLALAQTRVRRLIAYSSMAQAGYLLMGLSLFSREGLQAAFFYLAAYGAANLGVFAALTALSQRGTQDHLEDLTGAAWRNPFAAGCLTVFLLSLAGLPPLAGFLGKFWIFAAALKEGEVFLVVTAALTSMIGIFYYFKILRTLYFSDPLIALCAAPTPLPLRILLILLASAVTAAGLFPSWLLRAAESALR